MHAPSSNAGGLKQCRIRLQLHEPHAIDRICQQLGLSEAYSAQVQARQRHEVPTDQQVRKAVEAQYCKYLHPIAGGSCRGWMDEWAGGPGEGVWEGVDGEWANH